LESRDDELDAGTWSRVFNEAAALGVLHVQLSGGEPGMRRDLVDIAANAREAGLSTNLITSGVGITTRTMRDLWEAGLDHVQVSIQDADAVSADRIAGYRGAFQRKHALAAEAVRLGLPLTVNFVVHRANIERISDMVDLALKLKADRIEIAHVQYYGWALKNRAALMPTVEQVTRAAAEVEELRRKHQGKFVIGAGPPDCVGGWGRRSFNVTPSGRALPCHAADSISGLTFWNVRDHALDDIWTNSPAFNAFRGTDALPAQQHAGVVELAAVQQDAPYVYRRM
jgi:pyrroloquinoline quinone biosynthesis protein E